MAQKKIWYCKVHYKIHTEARDMAKGKPLHSYKRYEEMVLTEGEFDKAWIRLGDAKRGYLFERGEIEKVHYLGMTNRAELC